MLIKHNANSMMNFSNKLLHYFTSLRKVPVSLMVMVIPPHLEIYAL